MSRKSRRTGVDLVLLAGLLGAGSLWLRRMRRPPAEAEVRRFIYRYFETWSRNDMDGYRDCFDPQATVHLLGDDSRLTMWSLDRFIAVQRRELERAPWREIPLDIRIDMDGPIGRAVVDWRLYHRDRPTAEGVDYFTLAKSPHGWKIVHLIFRLSRRL